MSQMLEDARTQMHQRLAALGPVGRRALADALARRAARGVGECQLVAYVCLRGDATTRELAEALRRELPEHMLPSRFVPLATLPRLPNGKLDRQALYAANDSALANAAADEDEAEAFVSPRTDAEVALARVWSEVLGVDEIGAHDHFFELGGHSLLVNRVVARIHAVFGVELPLRSVFDAPTLEALATTVEDAVIAELAGASSEG